MAKKKSLAWPKSSSTRFAKEPPPFHAAEEVWSELTLVELGERVREWAARLDLRDHVVFLEGEMGAGKSTFARFILESVAPGQLSQGSPTFPLVTEYRAEAGYPIYHIDLYRLKNENELEDSGIESQIEEASALAIVEWASLFPNAFRHWERGSVRRRKSVIRVEIALGSSADRRSLRIR